MSACVECSSGPVITDCSCSNRRQNSDQVFVLKFAMRYDVYDVLPILASVLPLLSSHLLVLRLPHHSCTCVTCLSHLSYILGPSSVRTVSVVYGVTPCCLLGMHEPQICSNLTLSNSYREFQQLPRNCFWYHLPLFVITVVVILIILLVFFGVQIHRRNLGEGGGKEGK